MVALVATGCGGSHLSGRAIYVQRCAKCHTLSGRDTGVSGGDLVHPSLDLKTIESFTAAMPVQPKLSRGDVEAVSRYVQQVAAQRRAHP
jgi:mono/diheme cytochrome c family protein